MHALPLSFCSKPSLEARRVLPAQYHNTANGTFSAQQHLDFQCTLSAQLHLSCQSIVKSVLTTQQHLYCYQHAQKQAQSAWPIALIHQTGGYLPRLSDAATSFSFLKSSPGSSIMLQTKLSQFVNIAELVTSVSALACKTVYCQSGISI